MKIFIEPILVFLKLILVLVLICLSLTKPTGLVKVILNAPVQADLSASFILVKKFLVGATWRTGNALGGLLGFDISNQFHLGYSYESSYSIKTFKYNQGSHELALRFYSTPKKIIFA